MRLTRNLIIGSINHEKIRDYAELLSGISDFVLIPVERQIRNAEKLRLIFSNSRPPLENAIAKARYVNQGCHYPVISECSGIRLTIAGTTTFFPDDDLTTSCANIPMGCQLNRLLNLINGRPTPATYECALALHIEGIILTASASVDGTITLEASPTSTSGFDSVFQPNGHPVALSELLFAERAPVSPRAIALADLLGQFRSIGLALVKP